MQHTPCMAVMSRKLSEIPYNPSLKERARQLRKAGNRAEIVFWLAVKGRKLNDLDFDRQRIIGNYIVDFYCHQLALVIEIDGGCHRATQDYDAVRDNYLKGLGLQIIRFSDKQVLNALHQILGRIAGLTTPPFVNEGD
jgi:very-short-patch-repair endonuclease